MRTKLITIFLIMLWPVCCQATELIINPVQPYGEMYLLSGGVKAVVEHIEDQYGKDVAALDEKYEVSRREADFKQAQERAARSREALERKIEALKREYISKFDLTIHSATAELAPHSSVMGEISFTYTVKNHSDRIISAITYMPYIGEIKIPLSNPLFLEMVDYSTMIFGLAPGRTLSNLKHEPERLSFFAGELNREQIKLIRKNIASSFSLEVVEIRFSDGVAYKGDAAQLTLEEAFAPQLKPLKEQIVKADKDIKTSSARLKQAREQYAAERKVRDEQHAAALAELKKSAVRYRGEPGKKLSYTFMDVPEGDYILYATGQGAQVIFEVLQVAGKRQEVEPLKMVEDPFSP